MTDTDMLPESWRGVLGDELQKPYFKELSEFVEVGTSGVVTTWAWIAEPRSNQPLDRPFAWALVKLEGADTGLLHAVDAGDESRMRTGMRVKVRWREERQGHITDIECFEVDE